MARLPLLATNVNVPQKPHVHGKKKFLQPEATGPQFATSSTGNRYDPAAHNAHMEQLKAKIKLPMADRKAVMKEMQLKYHPDKNPGEEGKYTRVFQFLMQNRSWFLLGEK